MSVGEGDAVAGDGKSMFGGISCSICLDAVTDDGSRSWAKLLCGHQFHLDCIGSAFNVKGAMQCPNCRKIEKGQWLYASHGCRPLPEISVDDWAHDEDLYDFSYSEMSFGVHWCPFSGFTRLPSSLDEGEVSANTYHDLLGHHAVFAEHAPVSSTNHPTCPYIAFFGPIHHPSSSASNGSVSEGSAYNGHWGGPSLPSDVSGAYAFPSMDAHYHSWDHSSPFGPTTNRIGTPDQSSVLRTARNSSDIPRPVPIQPFILGHGSANRAPSSITSSMVPPYPGIVARPHRERTSHQAHFQQSTSNPQAGRGPTMMNVGRRSSSNHRGALPHVATSPPEQQQSNGGGFYYFSSSGRTFQEAEIPHRDRFHFWEREYHQQASLFPDRDSSSATSIWGPFHPPNGVGSSDVGDNIRSSNSFRQRHDRS